jgi:hypothetical protein
VRNVVFMGMGEPLANYAEVLLALRALTHQTLFALSERCAPQAVSYCANSTRQHQTAPHSATQRPTAPHSPRIPVERIDRPQSLPRPPRPIAPPPPGGA